MTKTPNIGPIAYLTGEYPRATDTFIQREVAGLRALGMDVQTCSIRKTGIEHLVGAEQKAEAKSTFYVLSAAKSPLRLIAAHLKTLATAPGRFFAALALALQTRPAGLRGLIYQLIYFAEAVVLAQHLKSQGVVHLHNHIAKASCTVAMLASRLGGFSYSFTLHGPDIFFEPHHWRLDAKIRNAAFVACISDFCRSQAMVFSDPKNWHKLHIVHCGVEPARYETMQRRTAGKRLTVVGRLAGVKGVPVLLDAVSELVATYPDLRVQMVGDGPERPALEARAEALGLADCVDFVGYKSQSEVAQVLQDTDIFVLPSFAEGVPVVLMEAMAAQVPVVTTRIAGVPELVQDGESGILVGPGNVAELTRALADLLDDPALRDEMGAKGRAKVVAEYNISKETAWLAELLSGYASGLPPSKTRPSKGETEQSDV